MDRERKFISVERMAEAGNRIKITFNDSVAESDVSEGINVSRVPQEEDSTREFIENMDLIVGLPRITNVPLRNNNNDHEDSSEILQKTIPEPQILTEESSGNLCEARSLVQLAPPDIDFNDVIQNKIMKFTDNNFLYLTYSVPRSSEHFTPYSLKVAAFCEVDKSYFYTISRHGVTLWSDTENCFTKLSVWQDEYSKYCFLMKIKLFKKFRLWKGFKVWQKTIQWGKYNAAKEFLENNLFLAIPPLSKATILIREEIINFQKMQLVDVSVIEKWALDQFCQLQFETMQKMQHLLLEFRNRTQIVLFRACNDAIIARGYSPGDEAPKVTTTLRRKAKDVMSYADRAKKRRYCQILTNFLRLCDYLTITLLHELVLNAFQSLLNALQIHHDLCSSLEIIKMEDLYLEVEGRRKKNQPQTPFFIIELLLKQHSIDIKPSRENFLFRFNEIFEKIMESILTITSFQNDPCFNVFTQPIIMGRQIDRLCGKSASVKFSLETDVRYKKSQQSIIDIINEAFNRVARYIRRFEYIRANYESHCKIQVVNLRKITEIDLLRQQCEIYTKELAELEKILTKIKLGIFQLDQSTFFTTTYPLYNEYWEVLKLHLPKLAIERIDYVSGKASELSRRLMTSPDTTYLQYLFIKYIDSCMGSLADLELELQYAYHILKLMKEFQIAATKDEREKYFDTEDLIVDIKRKIQGKLEQREDLVNNLNDLLQEDIKKLNVEIDEVRQEIVKDWLIDEKSLASTVKDTLSTALEHLFTLELLAEDYRSYQKEFKLDVTRFDNLSDVIQEIKQRQNLWNSLELWTSSLEEWYTNSFSQLDVENVTSVNGSVLRTCQMLEKFLPPNNIVPKLKTSAQMFQEKLPVISYLRNPALKKKHWLEIEKLLNTKFLHQLDEMKLKDYENVSVFDVKNADQIMEISGQASSEFSLELMLKKTENAWKDYELSLVLYQNYRDIFILAGVDELQALLDESLVNIYTIAASRHVGPIKEKVEEWIHQLDLSSKTLEEWTICQMSWIYLEAIFSAPDIQRQLPNEARMFAVVDKSWKEITRRANKMKLAMSILPDEGLMKSLESYNLLLEQVQHCLEEYLETKRVAFPRFYFLSNDELLEIMAQTRNPHAVQPHLKKCFDAITKLEFDQKIDSDGNKELTTDIIAMISPEQEVIPFLRRIKARGSVEEWLNKVEENMYSSLKRAMKQGIISYGTKDITEWLKEHPNQIVLIVSQQQWAVKIQSIFQNNSKEEVLKDMRHFESQKQKDLTKLAAIARTEISQLQRKVLCALITVDVHAKDTITNLVTNEVYRENDFNWLKMLRYYWDYETDRMIAKMASSEIPYYYEYIGASGVLVITPLTDRCYLCLMGALQMDLGGAPAGPAGTGKTETTKDLAKALAKQCVVFNCSEGLDYVMMGRFFSGLAQCGAWCCFDEFNRIDIEVLSVIAQQLITIKNAKAQRLSRFMFEGREIKLKRSCATFITMNPGYAGRTELPDNLKALFRPISMMVPDYALIAEVILYSEGFEGSKLLAQKMVQMYKLCSEQLSQQDHYDFGMRAVKSVLVMAGSFKRASPNQSEEITLIKSLRDSNLPKFLKDDAHLFEGILSDLFPGVILPETDYGNLYDVIIKCMNENNLQPKPAMITKTLQLYETMCVRWGVMLVGPTGGGKSTVLNTLARTLTDLYKSNAPGQYYRPVRMQILNPKAVSLDELYGYVNTSSLEWKDGLLGLAVRSAVAVEQEEHQWIVCDGPIDAIWIENMNTVLDDNKMLCLANSERIKLTPWVHMVFEVQDLSQASPATVSRCGMVYVDPEDVGWKPLVQSWLNTISDKYLIKIKEYLSGLFETYFDTCLQFTSKNCSYIIHQVHISKVSMVCFLLESLLVPYKKDISEILMCHVFIWTVMWSLGSNLKTNARELLWTFMKDTFKNVNCRFPEGSLWDYNIDISSAGWIRWSELVPKYIYDRNIPFFNILVPTIDTVRFGEITQLLIKRNRPVLLTGETGVGKSVSLKTTLDKLTKFEIITTFFNFSAQTTSCRIQEMIEERLEKRKRTVLGAPIGKTLIVYVDDVNLPKLDKYGSQPPIELLRQFLDYGGFYDREKMFFKRIVDVILTAACSPPGGGRNPLTPRFVRHFSVLSMPTPNADSLKTIFGAIISGFLLDFKQSIKIYATPLLNAVVEIFFRVSEEFLPTPIKSHYVFNVTDLSKCVQGLLQADSSSYVSPEQILRLFYHENMRVFHDRLINEDEKLHFKELMKEICEKHFENSVVKNNEVLLFGDFMVMGRPKELRVYEEIVDKEKLKSTLLDYLDDYNMGTGETTNLVLFGDAIEHIIRLARLLRAERGNGLLVALSGMGKQSLSKLAAHLNGYNCFQIELCRDYDENNFHDDLRQLFWMTGVKNTPAMFLLSDKQIVKEIFLEDISTILTSGEISSLYSADEYEKVILAVRSDLVANASRNFKSTENGNMTRDDIFALVKARIRANLHLVICMSPIGDDFRRRCRMFPFLVNCCTIDWFMKWPSEALYTVALELLKDLSEDDKQCESFAKICVVMHTSVEEASDRLYKELKRYYYTTPSSYLELLKLYKSLLAEQRKILTGKRDRISTGLNKILETNEVVNVMQEDLKRFAPLLEEQSKNMKELLEKLDIDTELADTVRKNVTIDEQAAKEKATESQEIADEAAKDLEIALPALQAAEDALKGLNKNDIIEVKSFLNPPKLVQYVLEPVCILLKAKADWASAKMLLNDVNFLKRLVDYDKEHIPEAILRKIEVYIDNKDFDPAKIEKVSKVCKSLCLWVRAVDQYAKVYKVVEPKVRKQQIAENELKEVMAVLRKKQQELADVEGKIQALKDVLEEKTQAYQRIQENVNLTSNRLNRAGRLTSALAEEEVRWSATVKTLTSELWAMSGDILVASAGVAYLGAFPTDIRYDLFNKWVAECNNHEIPSSSEFHFTKVLGEPYEIRKWNMNGLPRDNVSIENGIIVTKALRWPLMIDPQEQANRWIRNMEEKNNLQIIKMSDRNLLKTVELCIRQGLPMLIEETGETVDAMLQPVLNRQFHLVAGRAVIRLGDADVDYDDNFKLYMTTKLSNPHYLPQVCVKVTLINFLVSLDGLEDQLLADVVAIELPEMETQRVELIVRINNDKQQLLLLEDKVLKLLFQSKGNILDDEELVETLNEAKETSTIIADRLKDTEETEAVIISTREKYRPLASRGAVLYFVIVSLAEIDPMYQFSLDYFANIFRNVIKKTERTKVPLKERLQTLAAAEIYDIYVNVCRGLFEKHKLIFSFLLGVAVEKQLNHITTEEFDFLLYGPLASDSKIDNKPEHVAKLLTDQQWKCCSYLQKNFSPFNSLISELDKKIIIKLNVYEIELCQGLASTKDWSENLTPFQKLMLILALREEKLVYAIEDYVRTTIGSQFTEPISNNTLKDVYADTSPTIPLVFILSTGSDPMANLLKFVQEVSFSEKFETISLGQGQGPTASQLIEKAGQNGSWVFLQNCHLATSWMESMELIIRDIVLGIKKVHEDFRLFLSSMPIKSFPVSVLQNSVKTTNEPPKGLKANVGQALQQMDKNFFEEHSLGRKWCAVVFGICLFHGVLLERRKFGPLGWNIIYEFNDSDRHCGLAILDRFCIRENPDSEIPWDALSYINGEITWGGRVTDFWDQRCLKTILQMFASPKVLTENYSYVEGSVYRCPNATSLEVFRNYIDQLPSHDDPNIFGMSQNADIVFETQETKFFIMTVLEGQPIKTKSGEAGTNTDKICLNMIDKFSKALPQTINTSNICPELTKLDDKHRISPLTTVLQQEIDRFKKLLSRIHTDLLNLDKAIKGFIVMSEILENTFNSFLFNQVPNSWSAKGFLSTKSLAMWISDFQYRIHFIQNWHDHGLPPSIWISGFFFPQSFLTGTLQVHARKYNLPIDSLNFDFEVLEIVLSQQSIYESHVKGFDRPEKINKKIEKPSDGIIIHGIYLEAASWNESEGGLCDASLGELCQRFPCVLLKPCLKVIKGDRYEAPLYKTQVRAGVLSTTGHSTNFVISMFLKSKLPEEFWILRGTALITSITE